MNMRRGLLTYEPVEVRVNGQCDFVICTNPHADVTVPGNIRTYCTEGRCEGMPPVMTSPSALADHVHATLRPGVRAMVGNAGCELTFRHITRQPQENVQYMLDWAKDAYGLVGAQLVLAPMDFDIIHDVMNGGKLLAWAAEHRVPLAVFCGYRFLFSEDAFSHIREVCTRIPMRGWSNPYCFPYREVSEAIVHNGVEVWTGAGFHEGLATGAIERAKQFGMAGVFTTRASWKCWNEKNGDD